MSNKIEVYEQNTKTIICDVSGLTDLVGYDSHLTVKEKKEGNVVIENDGSINGLTVTFNLSYIDTSIAPKNYLYDITVESSTSKYTVLQDDFIVIDSVRY
jgi:hypothetical protein